MSNSRHLQRRRPLGRRCHRIPANQPFIRSPRRRARAAEPELRAWRQACRRDFDCLTKSHRGTGIGKGSRRGYSNDPRHGRSSCPCVGGGFCRGIDAGHVPWRKKQSVAGPGNKGVAVRAALAVAAKEDAETFADPCAHFQGRGGARSLESRTPPAVSNCSSPFRSVGGRAILGRSSMRATARLQRGSIRLLPI